MENKEHDEEKAKKVDSSEDSEGDTKRLLGLIFGVIIIFVLVFLSVNYFSSDSKTDIITLDDLHLANIKGELDESIGYQHNGFSVVWQQGLWYTQVQGPQETLFDVPLHFGPRDLEDVSVTGEVDERFKKDETYLTFDPLSEDMQYVALATAELSLNLVKGLGIMPVAACDKNETKACEGRPIITCEDGESTINLKIANETKVVYDGNCIIIQGKGEELVKAVDKFILIQYGIMERK